MTSRPNFVVFIPDQLRADAVGAFGNPHVQTPHLDALAARGTRFTNAYVQHPVCSPSRASFLTGWYPHTAGHRSLTHLIKPSEPNLLRILKDSGYHVTWAGMRGDTFAPGVTELSVHEHGFSTFPTVRSHDGPWPDDDAWKRVFYRGEIPDDDNRIDVDEASIRTAEHWLEAPPEDTPWVLFIPLLAPHCPFQITEQWRSLYDADGLPDPMPPDDRAHEPSYMQGIREKYGLDRITPEMWREVTATYYAMISRMDDHLGRVLSAVERTGAADDTVTLFFADHGEYLGDFGLIEKWPSAMHDCITRDPLIIAGPGIPEGQVREQMVEMVDVLPTVLELAGATAPHRHFGRSLMPMLTEPTATHRTYAFTEGGFTLDEEPQLERAAFPYDLKTDLQHENPEMVGKVIAVRDADFTYVWRLYEPAELYDRNADPGERVNLAGQPRYAPVEERMYDAMLRWLVDTADVIPYDSDPRLPAVDLPVPGAGRAPQSGQ